MEHIDWFYAITALGVIAVLGQTRINAAKLRRTQLQLRALLRHIDVVDPTALPPPSADVRQALERQGKFAAVKKYWEETGANIADCKEAVEGLQEDAGRSRRP